MDLGSKYDQRSRSTDVDEPGTYIQFGFIVRKVAKLFLKEVEFGGKMEMVTKA